MHFIKTKVNDSQKMQFQLFCTYLQNNIVKESGSGFCLDRNQKRIILSQQIRISCLEQFSILFNMKINKNMRLECNSILLKNGEQFQFKSLIRARQVMQFANLLSCEIRSGNMYVNPNTLSFEINLSRSLSGCQDNIDKIMNIMIDTMKELKDTTIFNIYTILRLGGQIDFQIEKMVEKKGITIRNFSKTPQKNITQVIQDLLLKQRDNLPLLEIPNISQFRQPSNLPKQTNQDNRLPSLAKVQKVQQQHKIDLKIQKYSACLNQEPAGKKNQYDKIRVVQKITLDKQNFKTIFSQSSSDIKVGINSLKYSQQQPAIKRAIVKKQYTSQQNKSNCKNEKRVIDAMRNKSSCFIAKYYDVQNNFQQDYKNSIVMDYYDFGCSNNLFKDTQAILSNKTKFELMYKISQGLRFLRDCNIIHRDIKFQNILIAKDLGVKITDFGQSYIKGSDMKLTTRRTLPYAPSQFYDRNTNTITSSYDTYSFGVMLDYILTQRFILPFRMGTSTNFLSQMIQQRKYPNFLHFNVQKYQQMYSIQTVRLLLLIVTLCLHPNPSKRPNQDIISIIMLYTSQNLISSLLHNSQKQSVSIY